MGQGPEDHHQVSPESLKLLDRFSEYIASIICYACDTEQRKRVSDRLKAEFFGHGYHSGHDND